MTQALVANGAAKVYILGRRLDVLNGAAASDPNVIVPVKCDVTSKADLQSAVDLITKQTGYVNLVIANSGVSGPVAMVQNDSIKGLRKALFDDMSMEDFTDCLRICVTGAAYTAFAFLELLDEGNKRALKGGYGAPANKEQKAPDVQSQIILTSSVGAYKRQRGPVLFPYVAAKAAVEHLMRQTSTTLAAYGIRVNSIAPGCECAYHAPRRLHDELTLQSTVFPTDMSQILMEGRKPDEETPEHGWFIPAKRYGTTEDIGGLALFMASRAGGYLSGMSILNDGGHLALQPATY